MIVFDLIFAVGLLVSLYYVLALLYHWIRYGFMYPWVWVMMPIYLIGTFLLLLISFAAFNAL